MPTIRVDPDDIEVSMDKGIHSIRSEHSRQTSEQTGRYSRVERRHGGFHRRSALPDGADPEGIQAHHGRHGVLEITIPKQPEVAPRRIQVSRTTGAGSESPRPEPSRGTTHDVPPTQQ